MVAANWYLREETLRPAVTTVVNYQYRLPLSRNFGGGTLSSSDGQRFPVARQDPQCHRRYFGFGAWEGATWASDRYSRYGSKVAPSTGRDATTCWMRFWTMRRSRRLSNMRPMLPGIQCSLPSSICLGSSSRHVFAIWVNGAAPLSHGSVEDVPAYRPLAQGTINQGS